MAAADGAAVPEEGAVAQPQKAEEATTAPPEPEVAPEDKAVAAVTENGEGHRITYKVREDDPDPLEITLPPKLLGSVVFRAGIMRDDDAQGAARLIQSTIGADQFDLVMDKMDRDGLTFDDEEGMTSLGRLLNNALAVYGLTAGESDASPES